MLTVRLPEDVERRLDSLASATGRTRSFYVREAILAHLEDLEDAYLAEAAYRRFRDGGEHGIPLEEVERGLGLAD